MSIRFRCLLGWWMLSLLSLASFAAPRNDFPLADAVKNQDKEAVHALLKTDADVNAAHADGATPLAWAAHWDDWETADLLIRAGADVNAANEYGITPLYLACVNGSASMVETLLKAGANPNSLPPTGETTLMRCASTGKVDAVKLLLAHGVDVNAKESAGGQTALMWAVAEKHPDVARLLVQSGADIHARSKGGFTPLLFAAQQGDVESARILLAAGANVNEAPAPVEPTENSMAEGPLVPLLVAAASRQEAAAIFFLEQGADPNVSDRSGTALHYAVRKGISEINLTQVGFGELGVQPPNLIELAKALLARGADPNARLTGNPDARNGSVLGSVVGAPPLFLAAASADLELTRLLLAHGADPMLATDDGITPLMVAAGVGHYEVRPPEEEKSALEIVKLFVEAGANVNAVTDTDHWTALHGAAFMGDAGTIKYLVESGAQMDVMDAHGQTPLSIVMDVATKGLLVFAKGPQNCPCPDAAELLVKLGAKSLEASGVQVLDVLSDSGKATPVTESGDK